ncbi:hypothetical protein [Algoriphagus resistens]|uniref:hypothetical protein n=1 Tax=Algoriphagus resistens TaxID=1750590 RepID=UPI0012F7649A|nr:hypothetical protein [Algoriphagus resistens]
MKTIFVLAIVCHFIPLMLLAQGAELVLKGSDEKRHIGFLPSNLEFTTELTGIEVDENHQVSLKEITAVDDLGNWLKPIGRYPSPTNYFTQHNEMVIGIEPPVRQAKSVSLQGVLEYFTISEELQSKLNLKNLQQRYHINLLPEKQIRSKLVLIDLQGLQTLKEEDEASYYQKIKEIHLNAGVGTDLDDAERYLDKALHDFTLWTSDPSKLLHFYRWDPEDNIVEIKVFRDGENLFDGTYYSNNTYTCSLLKDVDPETELRILVKNEDAIKEIPFGFENIILP